MTIQGPAPGAVSQRVEVSAKPKQVAILGAGAWGTVLANLARAKGHSVKLWSRRLNQPLAQAVKSADVLISAVSMKGVPHLAQQLNLLGLPPHIILVTATKGLNPDSYETPSQLWHAALPNNPLVVLSGPNLSAEIAVGKPAATVAASIDDKAACTIQSLLNSDVFRVYTNADPIGTELGGTLKNVMAIAVGVCDGLHLGTNAKSALMTRALPEMTRVGVYRGARPETFWGLSGLGDMLATCSSALSRNYRVGYGLAQGKPLPLILNELGSTAEGVNTTNVLVDLADQDGLEIPITRLVHQLLCGTLPVKQVVEELMERKPKAENYAEES